MDVVNSRKRVLAKVGGLWGPEAQSRERGWGEAQTRGLAWGLQCPEAQFYIKTKVIATTYNFSVQVSVSLANFSKLIYKHTQSTGSQARSCGRSHSAVFGVAVAVIAPRVVSWALSSCRVDVAVAVVALHVV